MLWNTVNSQISECLFTGLITAWQLFSIDYRRERWNSSPKPRRIIRWGGLEQEFHTSCRRSWYDSLWDFNGLILCCMQRIDHLPKRITGSATKLLKKKKNSDLLCCGLILISICTQMCIIYIHAFIPLLLLMASWFCHCFSTMIVNDWKPLFTMLLLR